MNPPIRVPAERWRGWATRCTPQTSNHPNRSCSAITSDITEVARIEAPRNPCGLAYDADRKLFLITLTGRNTLRVVDVADPASPAS